MDSNPAALITGGSRGIGRAISLALAEIGFDLIINYHGNHDAAGQVQSEAKKKNVRAEIFQADIASLEDQDRMCHFIQEKYGRIDVLVNNAGVAPKVRADILDSTAESFDRLITTNLRGPFFLTQRIARWMIAEKQKEPVRNPMVINISSISAYTSSINRADYCLAKAGISMMTRLFADRLAESGIPVYEIRPGIIRTDMTAPVSAKYDKMFAEGLTPLRRWGEAEDVAKAVVALVKGYFPYSTGEVFNVDGGFHLRRL
jgi:NAD(P)-dependent dehydrogenase (short-subunit alcohol dehydrogenase family)